jgi:hypothetical protein
MKQSAKIIGKKAVNAYIPKRMYDDLATEAAKDHRSMSSLVTKILYEWVTRKDLTCPPSPSKRAAPV